MWRQSCPPITVISSSKYCIHLKVNANPPSFWYFTFMYACPHPSGRLIVWEELKEFSTSHPEPWCLAGDFNIVLFDNEKVGGAPANQASCETFSDCINACQLLDIGFEGPMFTWKHGQLLERLGRVLCNAAWQSLFPNVPNIHLSIQSSDHLDFG